MELITRYASRVLFVFVAFIGVSGCVNVERERYPLEWSKATDLSRLSDLNGTYALRAESTAGRNPDTPLVELWYFLTRGDDDTSRNDTVRLTAIVEDKLLVELLDQKQERKNSVTLEEGAGFSWRNGALRMRPESSVERGALGTAAGTGTCRLRKTDDQGLVGEVDGIAIGLVLHVLPGVGTGNDWYYWQRVE